jgi:hypothetical protein
MTTTTTNLTKLPELVVDEFGNKFWHINGECHREDGPAVEYANGDIDWYLNGDCYDTFDKYVTAAKWTGEQIVEWKLTNEHTYTNSR